MPSSNSGGGGAAGGGVKQGVKHSVKHGVNHGRLLEEAGKQGGEVRGAEGDACSMV
jgi:hypothetical protein